MRELPIGTWGVRGSWHGKIAISNFDRHSVVIICCPTCGCDSSIGQKDISPDGGVIPVFYCPYGCGFRGSLTLLGYPEFYRSFQAQHEPKPDEGIERENDTNHS